MRKRIFFLTILVMITLLVSTGCSSLFTESADEGIKTYCNAILHRDDESVTKAKLSKDELERFWRAGFISSITNRDIFNEEQGLIIYTAFNEVAQKIKVETKLLAGNDKTARVEVIVNPVNMKEIDYDALIKEVEDKTANLRSKEDKMLEFTNTLAKYIRRLEPKGKASFTVDCKYDSDKQIWEPENNAMFELTLANTIIMK